MGTGRFHEKNGKVFFQQVVLAWPRGIFLACVPLSQMGSLLFKLSQSSNVVKGMISMKSPFAQLDRSRRPAVQINDEYGPQITAGRFFFC